MSLFDWYRPREQLCCPLDGHPLVEWQGKDGPRGLFVWQEDSRNPVDQLITDEEVRWPLDERDRFLLPRAFRIYSYDCPQHQPVDALCSTQDDVWNSTVLQVPLVKPQ